ncbi:MAG: GNAT family N-acetyltransferase [Dehalococcoidia bacterium]
MSVEIRALTADEMPELQKLGSYAFANNEDAPENEQTLQPEWTLCAFVDGRLAASHAAYPFRMRFNGAAANAAGVTAVSTYPEFRRRGLLRQIMEQAFPQQREQGQSVAILWASMGAIYQRFGYGLGSTRVRYEIDPRYAAFEDGEPPAGSVSLMALDDAREIMERIYIEHSRPRNLMLHRAPQMWQARRREQNKLKNHYAIYRNDAGEPRGYVQYTTKWSDDGSIEPGPSQKLNISDLIALDLDAYRALWESLRKHDLVSRIVWWGVPEDDPMPSLLLEPRELRRMTTDGIWLRVVDVEAALPQRLYGDRGEITIAISGDDLCQWNNGTYLLETDGERSEVRRTDREAEITMPPRTLASLIAGHDSATQLARAGLLEARDEQALRTADRLFATAYRPYCPDDF